MARPVGRRHKTVAYVDRTARREQGRVPTATRRAPWASWTHVRFRNPGRRPSRSRRLPVPPAQPPRVREGPIADRCHSFAQGRYYTAVKYLAGKSASSGRTTSPRRMGAVGLPVVSASSHAPARSLTRSSRHSGPPGQDSVRQPILVFGESGAADRPRRVTSVRSRLWS
jgi:hypothetical protein